MSQQNLISVSLSEEEKTSIDEAIATLTTTLLPKLKSLQPEDRQELPKMGDKTVAFVTKASEYCQQNPDLVPPYLDTDELLQDTSSVTSLRSIHAPLEQITEALSDTMMLAGSDAYAGALMFYNSVKIAAKSNVPKAGTIQQELSQRFISRKTAATEE